MVWLRTLAILIIIFIEKTDKCQRTSESKSLLTYITVCYCIIYPYFKITVLKSEFKFWQLTAGPGPMNINTPYRYLWIGLTDVAVEGTFVWNSTGLKPTYSYWMGGQPDNYNNNEDNVVLDLPEHGLWVDTYASHNGIASMCERTITPTIKGYHLWINDWEGYIKKSKPGSYLKYFRIRLSLHFNEKNCKLKRTNRYA